MAGTNSTLGTWLAAWLISGIIASAAFRIVRRAGLKGLDSWMVAAAFFPTPLVKLFGSGNSFIYAFDIFIPAAIVSALQCWKRAPAAIKTPSILLGLGAGLLPVLTSLSRESGQDLLWNTVNLVRLLGCLALMIHLASKRSSELKPNDFLDCFSILALGVVFAMILNGAGILKTDVFTEVQNTALGRSDSLTDINIDRRFYALGLFRATAGMVGALGACAFFARANERKLPLLSTIGAIAGLGAVMLVGSKTSLLTIVSLFGIWSVRSLLGKPTIKVLASVSVFLAITVVFIGAVYEVPTLRGYVPPLMLDLLGVEGHITAAPTLDSRVSRWSDTIDALAEGPVGLLGFSRSSGLDYNVSYFHDEYLSVMALGGVFGMTFYLVGIGHLWQVITRTRKTPIAEFARLAFLSGIIHGFSVANLQPALLFINIVAMACIIYGLVVASKYQQTRKYNQLPVIAIKSYNLAHDISHHSNV